MPPITYNSNLNVANC